MTKSILINHLLVSGSRPRPDARRLDRLAAAQGFDVGRTGRFGIGVLSYFMLANQVSISTRRAPEVGDSEGAGWRFRSAGPGSFGELRSDGSLEAGTEVTLHLKAEAIDPPFEQWTNTVSEYLRDLLVRLPCPFELAVDGEVLFSLRAGWTPADLPLEGFLGPGTTQQSLEDSAGLSVHWHEEEGVLPGGLGAYSIAFPTFELRGGRSFALMDVADEGGELAVREFGSRGMRHWVPEYPLRIGWRGVTITPRRDERRARSRTSQRARRGRRRARGLRADYQPLGLDVFDNRVTRFGKILVDFESTRAGRLVTDRDSLILSHHGEEAISWLYQRHRDLLRRVASEFPGSAFALLNYRLGDVDTDLTEDQCQWLTRSVSASGGGVWSKVGYPAMSDELVNQSPLGAQFRGARVELIPPLDDLEWVPGYAAPQQIVAIDFGRIRRPAALWTGPPSLAPASPGSATTEFPPAWKDVAAVTLGSQSRAVAGQVVWNQANPFVSIVSPDDWLEYVLEGGRFVSWVERRQLEPEDEIDASLSYALTRSPGDAAAWLLSMLLSRDRDEWYKLVERRGNVFEQLQQKIFGGSPPSAGASLSHWYEVSGISTVDSIGSRSWTRYDAVHSYKQVGSVLEAAGPDWTVARI